MLGFSASWFRLQRVLAADVTGSRYLSLVLIGPVCLGLPVYAVLAIRVGYRILRQDTKSTRHLCRLRGRASGGSWRDGL